MPLWPNCSPPLSLFLSLSLFSSVFASREIGKTFFPRKANYEPAWRCNRDSRREVEREGSFSGWNKRAGENGVRTRLEERDSVYQSQARWKQDARLSWKRFARNAAAEVEIVRDPAGRSMVSRRGSATLGKLKKNLKKKRGKRRRKIGNVCWNVSSRDANNEAVSLSCGKERSCRGVKNLLRGDLDFFSYHRERNPWDYWLDEEYLSINEICVTQFLGWKMSQLRCQIVFQYGFIRWRLEIREWRDRNVLRPIEKISILSQKKKKIVHPLATFPDRKIRIYCQLFPSVIFFINETRSTNRPPVIQDSLYQTSNSVAIRVRSNFIKEGANKQKLLCSLFLKERERADRDKDKGTKLHR